MALPDDLLFPVNISYNLTAGTQHSTAVGTNRGGYEKRNKNWLVPRERFNLIAGARNSDEWGQIYSVFRILGGKFETCLFKDWSDYRTSQDTEDAITDIDSPWKNTADGTTQGDGSTTTFQIQKAYKHLASGLQAIIELKKIVVSTAIASVDGSPATLTSVDITTGIATFTAAPGAGLEVAGGCEFYKVGRFDSDYMPFDYNEYLHGDFNDLPFITVR